MARRSDPTTDKATLRIFWSVVWRNKSLFLRSLIYMVGTVGINILVPLFISLTLAELATRQGDIFSHLVPLIVAAAVGVSANYFGFRSLLLLQAKCQSDLLQMVMDRLLSRSVGFHTNTIGGKLVSNALDYPTAFAQLTNAAYINMTPFVLIMVTGIGVVLVRSVPMAIALILVVGVTVVMTLLDNRQRSSFRQERKDAQNAMIAHASDTLVNAQAVKTFASETAELAHHQKLSEHLLDLRFRDWSRAARNGSVRMVLLLSLQIVFIGFVGYLLRQDPSVLAIGIFSFSYIITLTNRLFELDGMLRNVEEAFLSATSMTEVLLEQTEITDKPHATKLRVSHGNIELADVHFTYHDESSTEEVFKGLDLRIPAGQKVGLVGPSGGGKSTLTRLLLRFDDVDSGSISIDGQNVRDVTQASLRQAVSYVPQEPLLFHRSVLENIAYGRPDATLEQVRQAATLAFADEFITKLPKGYDTIVGERGVKLSGGQRQRVAIARAILKDAPILVLDEATSALDSESEVYIQKALEQLMQNRTTLVIAHRLSTIQKMDRIIVLDNGHIIEGGTHRSLQKRKGLYAKLWAHQSGGFIED